MQEYVKLSSLVDGRFTVNKVYGYTFKKWDDAAGKMLVSENYMEGYDKRYGIDTDKGKLEVSKAQISSMLEAVIKDGVADLNNVTFEVKSNGESGKDIRYYFNPQWTLKTEAKQETKEVEDEIDIESLPF